MVWVDHNYQLDIGNYCYACSPNRYENCHHHDINERGKFNLISYLEGLEIAHKEGVKNCKNLSFIAGLHYNLYYL